MEGTVAGVSREELEHHPWVQRLLNNSAWRPAADSAIDYFIDGKKCAVPSWPKSSTWHQVKAAYEELKKNNS